MKCEHCGTEIVKSLVSWRRSGNPFSAWEPVEVEAREALGFGPIVNWIVDSETHVSTEVLHTPSRCIASLKADLATAREALEVAVEVFNVSWYQGHVDAVKVARAARAALAKLGKP